MMFQKFAEVLGYERNHPYVQCGFQKCNATNFSDLDLRLFIDFVMQSIVQQWMEKYEFTCFPYYKIEYSRHPCRFDGQYMSVIPDLDHLTTFELLKMKEPRPYQQIYLRVYYK